MKKVYYARPINIYGTEIDKANVAKLSSMGFEVVDPSKAELAERYKVEGMQVYFDVIDSVDCLCFFSPIESLTQGVYKEINYAESNNKPVFEIPNFLYKRILNVEETRLYLNYIGFR